MRDRRNSTQVGSRVKMGMRREQLRARAKKVGLYIREAMSLEKGGRVHMRIFDDPKADYYMGTHIYEARSLYRAEAFIIGFTAGRGLPKW